MGAGVCGVVCGENPIGFRGQGTGDRQMKTYEIEKSIYVSRRTMLRLAATSAVAGASRAAWAEEAKTARGELAPLNRFSRMVQEWFVDQVRAAEDKIKQRLAALK